MVKNSKQMVTLMSDIKLSEVLGMELNPLSKKVKEFIDDKLDGLVQFESDEYPGDFFYKKGNIVLFRQDFKNKKLWCSFENYSSIFREIIEEIGLSHIESRELTRVLVGTHLNCKEFKVFSTPQWNFPLVEAHLNFK